MRCFSLLDGLAAELKGLYTLKRKYREEIFSIAAPKVAIKSSTGLFIPVSLYIWLTINMEIARKHLLHIHLTVNFSC